MTDSTSRRSRRATLAPAVLVVLLGIASLVRPGDEGGPLQLASPDRSRVNEMRAAMAALPDDPLVLLGLDPDLGTYPEIRPAVRAAIDDLLARGASLAFVSFTPEGRAIASAELDRLATDGVAANRLLDLGFIAGSEAGMVRAVTDLVGETAEGELAAAIREAGGMAAFQTALVVGGGDLGPRTWVEQVGTRLPDLRIMAIAPTFMQPELAPYLRTGQLTALLATVRDGAAYTAIVANDVSPGIPSEHRLPSALSMLIGMLVALVVIAWSVTGGLVVGRGDRNGTGTAQAPAGEAGTAE